MKQSIPVSDSLSVYFSDPCPVLSDNNSRMIAEEIRYGYDWVVEYGLGASTLYFLNAAGKQKISLVSVENNFDWFKICIAEIKKQTGYQEVSYSEQPWSIGKIRAFADGESNADVPQNLKRFSNWADRLTLGPFYRLSPQSKSRFSGFLGPVFPLAKPILKAIARVIYLANPALRPCDGEWIGQKGESRVILRNAAPSIKDQYGEAPTMMDYIRAGTKDLQHELESGKAVSALFLIDGGPRHKIVQEILRLEDQYKNFRPTIILCDASRVFYHPVLAQRPSGQFVAGTGKTLKGQPVAQDVSGDAAQFWTGGDKTAAELAQQEVWLYRSSDRAATKQMQA